MKDHSLKKCSNTNDGKQKYLFKKSKETQIPHLRLVEKTNTTSLISSSHLPEEPDNLPSAEIAEVREDENYPFEEDTFSFTLARYFNAVSCYPLLTEEEEKEVAKEIKAIEKRCKQLAIDCSHLLHRELFRTLTHRLQREAWKALTNDNPLFNLFATIATLEKKRKQTLNTLASPFPNPHAREKLQEYLYKVEAEIAKSIARIQTTPTFIQQTIRTLNQLVPPSPPNKQYEEGVTRVKDLLEKLHITHEESKRLKNKLIQANLRLVISIAKRYCRQGLSLLDLIQEGNLGLIRAIDTYDYRRGHRLITYASWWIRQAMIRALDHQLRTIRTPVYLHEQYNKLMKASHQLLKESHREPSFLEVAQKTNSSLASVEKVLQSVKDTVSLDTIIPEKGEGNVAGGTSIMPQPFDHALIKNRTEVIESVLSNLTPREKDIIMLRFGLGPNNDHTLEEIGSKFKVSRERIRQLLESALQKLRSAQYAEPLREFIEYN